MFPLWQRQSNSAQVSSEPPVDTDESLFLYLTPSFPPAVSQTFFSKPPGGLYSLPYLSEGLQAEPPALSRAEWWEILFFIKKLDSKQQHEVSSILQQSLDEQVSGPKEHLGMFVTGQR